MPKTTIGGSATDNTVGSGKYELNITPGAQSTQTLVGANVTDITNNTGVPLILVIEAFSSVNEIYFARSAGDYKGLGMTNGLFVLGPGDVLEVDHSGNTDVHHYPL